MKVPVVFITLLLIVGAGTATWADMSSGQSGKSSSSGSSDMGGMSKSGGKSSSGTLGSSGANQKMQKPKMKRSQMIVLPEVVVYEDVNFEGRSLRTNLSYIMLGADLNDQISSVIVVSGEWRFCKDPDFGDCTTLGPGYYENIEEWTDTISSFEPVLEGEMGSEKGSKPGKTPRGTTPEGGSHTKQQ